MCLTTNLGLDFVNKQKHCVVGYPNNTSQPIHFIKVAGEVILYSRHLNGIDFVHEMIFEM